METNSLQLKSIWGNWWLSIRKWFYPTWLIYETLIRFYDYTYGVYNYFNKQQENISPYIGDIGASFLNITCSSITFLVCTFFLTVPTSFILYKFFTVYNLSDTKFEVKLKKLL